LVVNTPTSSSIPTGVKVTGLDIHGEELQLCPKLKKDHDCVTKTLHEELFAGGAKVDVTFYCKGSNSGGCKTKKPARVCLCITLIYEEGIIKVISSPFTVKGNRRQKIKRVCNSTRRENLSVTTVIDNPSLITEMPMLLNKPPPTPAQIPPLSSQPSPSPSLNHSPKLAEIIKMEQQPKIKLEKNCPPSTVIHQIKQEPSSMTSNSDPFIQISDKYRYSAPQKRVHQQISFNTPKTEDSIQSLRSIRHSLPYYFDSGGPLNMENSQPYIPNHMSEANAFLHQKGPYSPDDYSIPPDEEGDDYYSDEEDHLPLVKVEPYPFNTSVNMDKPYALQYVNSIEYYRDERYGYRFVKRHCLGKGMY